MTAPALTAVIMAGGQGQRFWPLSTADRPKQFLDLERRGRTLLQATFDRLLPLTGGPAGVYVATAARYLALVREQLPELPTGNLLIEPTARDSAPAIALASLAIHERTSGATLGFFPSDHGIGDPAAFHTTIRHAIELAEPAGARRRRQHRRRPARRSRGQRQHRLHPRPARRHRHRRRARPGRGQAR